MTPASNLLDAATSVAASEGLDPRDGWHIAAVLAGWLAEERRSGFRRNVSETVTRKHDEGDAL